MQSHSRIFTDKYLDIKSAPLEKALSSDWEEKKALIRDWQEGIRSGRILQTKEEQLQSSFLHLFFGDVLGYAHSKGAAVWNLEEEQKTLADSTKMDGALGFFSLNADGKTAADIRVVIELKDARTDLDKPQTRKNDRRTPVQQAFDYASAVGGTCRWVIVSNFVEIRLYFHSDRTRYESFDILSPDRDMKRFLFLLHRDRLITEKGESFTDVLYRERQEQEKNISRRFYADYRQARLSLFHHIREENQGIAETVLLNRTQKLLDRILFVCFCEDFGILPHFTFRSLLKSVKEDKFNRSDSKIWQRVKALFDAIDSGYPEENINKFNGGLFAEDEILDSLVIKDAVLEHVIALEQYDFASDLNVNILGHIFEQSVTDMEELKAEIAGQRFDRKKGKRKKEGIFYTPEYITRYIVEEAVGGWLADRKSEIGFDDLPELTPADYDAVKKISGKRKANRNIELHIQALEAYREKLKYVKVLDPACGSGAFLNQVFDYLYKEGQKVNNDLAMLKGGQREVFDPDKDILTCNIFGADLNAESVEITKLSLWLKTANKNKELTTLDSNIKCGNSLIDDPKVAGEKAFDWNKEFPEIMQSGGFDVVVGNPPYIYSRNQGFSEHEKQFLYKTYQLTQHQLHSFALFIEQSFKLLSERGTLGFIIPNNWLTLDSSFDLRQFLLIKTANLSLINLGENIFEEANVDTCIVIFKKGTDENLVMGEWERREGNLGNGLTLLPPIKKNQIKSPKFYFQISKVKNLQFTPLLEMIEKNSISLGKITEIKAGIAVYEVGAGIPKQTKEMKKNRVYHSTVQNDHTWFKYLDGNNVSRYHLSWNGEFVKYGENLSRKREEYFFEIPRILVRQIPSQLPYCLQAVFCEEKIINDRNSMIILQPQKDFDLKYLLSVLNSRLVSFWFFYVFDKFQRKTFPQFKISELKTFPMPNISIYKQKPFIDKTDFMLTQNKAMHHLKSDFLTFVQNELKPVSISKKLENWPDLDWDQFKIELKKAKVKFDDLNLKDRKQWQDYFLEQQKKTLEIKSVIDKTDREIDKMVYDLYGLTPEEIRIVEGSL
ncbi:MAG: N-6 DNA methylase [Desulfobacterales bacterium]